MAIYKNKNQIRKEVAQLIDNIKQHSDNIAEHKRIPQIELEFITAKIKKLYEKSIVFNYLNAMDDEQDPSTYTEKSIIDVEVPVFEKMPHLPSYKNEQQEKTITVELKLNATENITEKTTNPVPEEEKNIIEEVKPVEGPKAEPAAVNITPPVVQETKPVSNLKDLKNYIGINDKIQFTTMLFKGNSTDYENTIALLNGITELATAKNMIAQLKQNYQWDKDSDAYLNLISLIELRYK